MAYDEQIADGKAWKDIPTCKSQGLDMEYLMLRGIFMSPKATKDQVEYYIDLFQEGTRHARVAGFMKSGAFNTTFLTGADYAKWGRDGRKASRSPDERGRFPRAWKLIEPIESADERVTQKRLRIRSLIPAGVCTTWSLHDHE